MPFVIPVKAMALTVSTLMCGTMFTTYYFCVHDSECLAGVSFPVEFVLTSNLYSLAGGLWCLRPLHWRGVLVCEV